MQHQELIRKVADKLEATQRSHRVMVGFDGFVDEIIHVVDERTDVDNFTRVQTISALADRLSALAGLSGNVELVTIKSKLGGNGPILANALISQGHRMTYIGAIGASEIHPLFSDFGNSCEKVISLCNPAHTDALEFNDGKLMLGKTEELKELDWDMLMGRSSEAELRDITTRSSLLAFTNWTMIPGMNSIISGFTRILAELGTRPAVFFDLADPSKRTDKDLLVLFDLFREMTPYAKIILGMNMNESSIIARLTGIAATDLPDRAAGIREALRIDTAVIHPTHGAAAADSQSRCWVDGPFTNAPKLTTGAGDNFNAGFCHGCLMGLNAEESLVTGVFTSGFYVRQARSPRNGELIRFMRDWSQNSI